LFPIEYQENRYQKKLASIYGNSKSKSTPGMSLLEVALLKCVASDSGTGYCTITYELTWELPSFLEKFFPAKQPLGSILTLTGGPVDAYESSCKDYLTNTFPDIGPYMLECLERTLIGSDASMFYVCILPRRLY
jgi:hypothetical protein